MKKIKKICCEFISDLEDTILFLLTVYMFVVTIILLIFLRFINKDSEEIEITYISPITKKLYGLTIPIHAFFLSSLFIVLYLSFYIRSF